jgi:hypothetical protein
MILSAAIVDKDGSIYVARQYCEMTKTKVEALYIAFARLIPKGKQHTVIDTSEVRYIYRAINEFYCVLITDKHSNILEDIKTLSLFTSAIVQYASTGKGVTEEGITEDRFELLFVFDEIINMGYRQVDDLSQLSTIMAMHSEEERAAQEALSKKEREAKAKAAEKSKELDQQRKNEILRQMERSSMGGPRGFGPSSNAISSSSTLTDPVVEPVDTEPTKPSKVMSRGKALKLKPRN